jgi:hypothetical protein
MSNEASEFTQKAIQMAREKMRNEDIGELVYDEPAKETAHVVHLTLTESDIAQLYRLMDLGVSKSREAITRCRRFPTDNIKSSLTIKKHEALIEHIEALRYHLTEEAQW